MIEKHFLYKQPMRKHLHVMSATEGDLEGGGGGVENLTQKLGGRGELRGKATNFMSGNVQNK